MQNFETVEVTTDLLILGGGMAACGAAVEAAHWAKKNGLKVTLVDKAAMDRSGAVAMGLSAINQYVDLNGGKNTLKDYCDYVRNDLMGITREDLVANIARHVDSTVHLFEKWGLPIGGSGRRVLRAGFHHAPADGWEHLRGRGRFQRPRRKILCFQGQGDLGGDGRRRARLQAAFHGGRFRVSR